MFTGIIESLGELKEINPDGTNVHIAVSSGISSELKVDQSVAHNGVCLTITRVDGDTHFATIVDETMSRTNFKGLKVGDLLNLERCLPVNGRFDGHIVQGHVDQVAECSNVVRKEGSYVFEFNYDEDLHGNITVQKGSICINGISLTVVESDKGYISVEIIPYTFENTNLGQLQRGDIVNLEFDILGKYISKLVERRYRELPNS